MVSNKTTHKAQIKFSEGCESSCYKFVIICNFSWSFSGRRRKARRAQPIIQRPAEKRRTRADEKLTWALSSFHIKITHAKIFWSIEMAKLYTRCTECTFAHATIAPLMSTNVYITLTPTLIVILILALIFTPNPPKKQKNNNNNNHCPHSNSLVWRNHRRSIVAWANVESLLYMYALYIVEEYQQKHSPYFLENVPGPIS